MAKTYADIAKQIDALTREAEKLKRKEVESVIARIKEAIATYELTASDLGLGGARKGRKPGPAKSAKPAKRGMRRAVKFKDGAGNTWGGRGPRPQWLRNALAGGKQLQDFAA